MKKIKLTQGKYAKVDDEDYEWLNKYKWHIVKGTNTDYAETTIGGKQVFMHRLILDIKDRNIYADHINRNGLDNRRCNLRKCTPRQNACNSIGNKNSTSKYKGVCWYKNYNMWKVAIVVYDKGYNLGYYKDEKLAARIYDYNAKKNFKEFAYLNFPYELFTNEEYKKIMEKNYSSKYVGVCWSKNRKNWKSYIYINCVRKHIGCHKNETDAAIARDNYIINNNLNINKHKLNFNKKG